MKKLASALLHLVLLAVVCAAAAYWVIKIFTPQPTPAPPPIAAPPPREPDPTLTARMFGLVQIAQAVVTNVQVMGVFAAGKDSSAVLVVDGKPPRTYLVGQEVSPGTRLSEVAAEVVVLDGTSGRQELRLPGRAPVLGLGGGTPPPAYVLNGNTLSATGSDGGSYIAPAPGIAAPTRPPWMQPGAAPTQPPGFPQPVPPSPAQPPQSAPPGQPLQQPVPGQPPRAEN